MRNKNKGESMEEKDDKKVLDDGLNILNAIISTTFTRHNDLTEKEFLERLKAENSGLNEEQLVRVAMFNMFVEFTKEILRLQQKTNLMAQTMEVVLKEKENGKKD